MTDKQIIIDGCDVSGCTRYCADNGKCTAFKSQYLCSERNNCYTKRILKKNKTINILKEKLLRKEQECEELKRANLHIENNREHKANKLNRIEKLILACTTGYTDEFVQELLVILHEPEPSSFENKYKQTLTEIKEIAESEAKYFPDGDIFARPAIQLILQKISDLENEKLNIKEYFINE